MKLLHRETAVAAKTRFDPLLDGGSAGAPAARPASPGTREDAGRPRFRTLVLLSALWFVAMAALRPLLLPDEGRYAGIAWEMLHSGDWLTPTLNGLPFFHKPPLFYWITAGAMSVLGPTDLAARVAPLAGAWIAAAACYLFVRRWWSEATARIVFVALLLQPLFALGGMYANLDMLVAGFLSATILLLADAALSIERGQRYRGALAGAYAVAALGVLAKGLIGFVIPALVVGGWLLATRRWRTALSLFWVPGLALFLVIAAPWFVAMQLRYPDFSDYFFFVQHVRRFATSGFNNAQPFWFYPAVLLAVSVPWLPWIGRQFSRARYTEPGRGDLRVLMWAWAGLVTLFFSLPESKLVGYILPALPPLAVLAADGFADRQRTFGRSTSWRWKAVVLLGVLFSTGGVIALTLHPIASSREIAAALRASHAGGEPVYMLEAFYFDVPYYAQLRAPVRIVDNWSDPGIAQHDNWRKELADGARFAPARAEVALVEKGRFAADLCETPVSWVIGESTAPTWYPLLNVMRLVATVRGVSLWRVDTTAPAVAATLGCTVAPAR